MPAPYNKFDSGVACLCGDADVVGAGGSDAHMLVAYLSNTTPLPTHVVQADLPSIPSGNGYAGKVDLLNQGSQVGGLLTVRGQSFLITATGGPIGPFRYLVLADPAAAGTQLIAWFDYGAAITLFEDEGLRVLVESQPVGSLGVLFTVQ